jgi:hypothetical protein
VAVNEGSFSGMNATASRCMGRSVPVFPTLKTGLRRLIPPSKWASLMKVTLLFVLLAIAGWVMPVHAQQTLVEYDIQGITGFTGTELSPSTTAADVLATGITFPSNLQVDDGFWEDLNEGLFLVNWDDGAFNINNNYMEFTVSATSGNVLTLDNLTLGVGRESTNATAGPQRFRVYSNLDGYSFFLAEAVLPGRVGEEGLTQTVMDIDLGSEFYGIESVTFRIHGHQDVENLIFSAGGGLAHVNPNGASGSNEIEVSFSDIQGVGSNVVLTGSVIELAEPPTVTTTSPPSVSTTSAILGGNVTDDGGATVTERGVVFSTAPNPTIADNVVQMGSGTGPFSQSVTGLNPGTLYYVRAYAINSEGLAYGSQQDFTTAVSVSSIERFDPVSALTNADQVVYQVNFTGPVSGLSSSNFSVSSSGVSGASFAAISGSGSTYSVTVNTGTGSGELSLILVSGTGVSPAIINVPFSGQTYNIDKTPPEVALSSSEISPTNANPIPLNIEFTRM